MSPVRPQPTRRRIAAPAGYHGDASIPRHSRWPAGGHSVVRRDHHAHDAARSTPTSFGALTWSDGVHTARSPIVVRPVAIVAPGRDDWRGRQRSDRIRDQDGLYRPSGVRQARPHRVNAVLGHSGRRSDRQLQHATPAANQGIATHDIVVPAGTTRAAHVDVRSGDRRRRRYRSLSLQSECRQLADARRR